MSEATYQSLLRALKIATVVLGLIGIVAILVRYLVVGTISTYAFGGCIAMTGSSFFFAAAQDIGMGRGRTDD